MKPVILEAVDVRTGFDAYQKAARRTAIYPEEYSVIYPTLGLVGEAGEVAEKVKKLIRDEDWKLGLVDVEKRRVMLLELGDVLWYLAMVAHDLDCDLGEVAVENLKKLQDRQARDAIKGSGDNR